MQFRTRKADKRVFPLRRKISSHDVKKYPYRDFDKDGVINKYDCKPLDKRKQGIFHDIKDKLEKVREKRYEESSAKHQKRLDELNERLEKRINLAEKQVMKTKQLAERKEKLDNIKQQEKHAKQMLSEYTITGKIKKGAVKAGKAAGKGIAWTGERAAIGAKKFYEGRTGRRLRHKAGLLETRRYRKHKKKKHHKAHRRKKQKVKYVFIDAHV